MGILIVTCIVFVFLTGLVNPSVFQSFAAKEEILFGQDSTDKYSKNGEATSPYVEMTDQVEIC